MSDTEETTEEEAPKRPTDQEIEDQRKAAFEESNAEHMARRAGKPWPPE